MPGIMQTTPYISKSIKTSAFVDGAVITQKWGNWGCHEVLLKSQSLVSDRAQTSSRPSNKTTQALNNLSLQPASNNNYVRTSIIFHLYK